MVLYCVQHGGNIIKALTHKIKYHPSEKALIIQEFDVDSHYCPKLENVEYATSPLIWNMVIFSQDRNELIEHTVNTIEAFFEKNGITLSDFNSIYALYDMFNPYILYCELKNIKYAVIESEDNHFNFYWSRDFVKERESFCYVANEFSCISRDMHLLDAQGSNCIKGYLYSEKSKFPEGSPVPNEVFGYLSSLATMDPKNKERLLNAYGINNSDFENVILFNSPGFVKASLSNNNVEIPSKYMVNNNAGNVYFFYKIILDYYFSDYKFILKLHPESNEKFVESFSGERQLDNAIPAELLAIEQNPPKVLCPIQSTSLNLFKYLNLQPTAFGMGIFAFFKVIHFVYSALAFIETSGRHFEKICIYGIDCQQMRYFCDWAFKKFSDVEFEPLNSENIQTAKFIVSACSDEKFKSMASSANGNCVVIVNDDFQLQECGTRKMKCSLIDLSENEPQELQSFCWTILSKNKDHLKKADAFAEARVLKRAQIRLLTYPYFKQNTQ